MVKLSIFAQIVDALARIQGNAGTEEDIQLVCTSGEKDEGLWAQIQNCCVDLIPEEFTELYHSNPNIMRIRQRLWPAKGWKENGRPSKEAQGHRKGHLEILWQQQIRFCCPEGLPPHLQSLHDNVLAALARVDYLGDSRVGIASFSSSQSTAREQEIGYVNRVVGHMKNRSQLCCMGWLAESHNARIMEAAGVRFITSFEGAPVDGAFIDESRCDSVPPPGTSSADMWRWARQYNGEPIFATYDIKYSSLTGLKIPLNRQRDYSYSNRRSRTFVAEVFLIHIEGLPDYVVVVPRDCYHNIIDGSQAADGFGISPLISQMSPWMYPFVVHKDDVKVAVIRLSQAARQATDYTNPTTGVCMKGWKPKSTNQPPISPESATGFQSLEGIEYLRQQTERIHPEIEFRFNPVAPLIGDFVLRVPPVTSSSEAAFTKSSALSNPLETDVPNQRISEYSDLDIEYKVGQMIHRGAIQFSRRSPFARNRQWHFLIVQPTEEKPLWYCFARNDVGKWSRGHATYLPATDIQAWKYEGLKGLRRMLTYIRQRAQGTIRHANTALIDKALDDNALESIIKTNLLQDEQRMSQIDTESNSNSDTTPEEQRQYCIHTGLHWLYEAFNQQCRDRGQMVFIPLDYGHPHSATLIVKHSWSDEDEDNWDKYRILPRSAFSPGVKDTPCLLARCQDLHNDRVDSIYPLWMKPFYWQHPFPSTQGGHQPYLMLGSTASPASLMASPLNAHPSYLLLPSEFTTHHEPENFRSIDEAKCHTGDKYFRQEYLKDVLLPSYSKGDKKTDDISTPLRIGSPFMKNKRIDPQRFSLNVADGSVYNYILTLMNGKSTMDTQSSQEDNLVPKESYLATVKRVHQAAWDYGLRRQFGSTTKAS